MVRVFRCSDDLSDLSFKIRNGGLIVYPTDTVYGLGCDPCSSSALKRCFEVKERPEEKLLPVLFLNKEAASDFVIFGPLSNLLALKFWPGKLTMILPLRKELTLPFELTRGGTNLAVRVPSNDCTLKILSAAGGSLIGTSANISGTAPTSDPNNPQLLNFAKRCDLFVKDDSARIDSLPSTVIQISTEEDDFSVLREGAISVRSIEDYLKLSKADSS